MGLGDLRRHKKGGHVSGLACMVAFMIHNNPSNYQIMRVRFLTLAIILLAPEGAGLFMYLFLWLIIPPESDKEYKSRKKFDFKASSPISPIKKHYTLGKQAYQEEWTRWAKGGYERSKRKLEPIHSARKEKWWSEVVEK